jgi:hypothetical protein
MFSHKLAKEWMLQKPKNLGASNFEILSNSGRRLISKFEVVIGYPSICKWLGGGLKQIAETLQTSNGPLVRSGKWLAGVDL